MFSDINDDYSGLTKVVGYSREKFTLLDPTALKGTNELDMPHTLPYLWLPSAEMHTMVTRDVAESVRLRTKQFGPITICTTKMLEGRRVWS